MKQLSIILLFLLFSCNAKEKQDKAKTLLGRWALTTNKQHEWEVTADSILYSGRKDRSTYKLFGDSIKIMNDYFRSVDNYDLKFNGNDMLTLDGTDGEHIYMRIK